MYSGSLKLKFIGALEIGERICAVYYLKLLDPSTVKIYMKEKYLDEKTLCAEWFSIESLFYDDK